MNDKRPVNKSKFLSLVLRHRPWLIDIELDPQGWVSVEDLLKGCEQQGITINEEELSEIVATNEKKRFSLSEDKKKIRANYGHSLPLKLDLVPKQPPDILYHGTTRQNMETIRQQGLKRMQRTHVHLSQDYNSAINVGGRHGKPIVLEILAGKMYSDGFVFYLTESGVWLVDNVPPQYLSCSSDLEKFP